MDDSTSAESHPDEKQKLIRGGILMTLAPVSAMFFGLFISMLINQYIPDENLAVYSWFNIMNSFLTSVIPFQIPSALSRYLAVAKGSNNPEEVNRILKTNSVLSLILVPMSGLVALVATPLVFDITVGIGGQYAFLDVIIFSIGIMSLNLSLFTLGSMRGLQEFEKVGLARFVANILGQGVVVVLIFSGLGIRALLIKWVVVGLVTVVFLGLTIRKVWSFRGKMYPLRPLLVYAFPGVIAFLFAFFFREFLIRHLFQSFGSDLGLYEFAIRLVTFIDALTIGWYTTLNPYYAKALGRGGFRFLEREFHWTMRISFFFFLPLVVGTVVVAPSIFLLLFENYYWSYQYFAILMMRTFFNLFYKPYNSILSAAAKNVQLLMISLFSSVASGVLMILLVYFGPLIVVISYGSNVFLFVVAAYVSSVFFSALFAGMLLKRRLGISLGLRHIMPLVAIAVSMILPAALIHFLRLPPLIELVTTLGICTLVYLVPIRLFRLVSANEIRKATLFLPKRLATPFANILILIFVRGTKEQTDV